MVSTRNLPLDYVRNVMESWDPDMKNAVLISKFPPVMPNNVLFMNPRAFYSMVSKNKYRLNDSFGSSHDAHIDDELNKP